MTGCTFGAPGTADDADDDAPQEEIPPGPAPVPRHCAVGAPEQDLVLCVDFEDPSLAQHAIDSSPYGNNAIATKVRSVQRIVGEQAAELAKDSSLRVPEAAMLDLQQFTIEMWIKPMMEPADKKVAGLFDNPGQYSMVFEHQHTVRCGLSTALGTTLDANSEASVPMNMWSHVACRYDGHEMRIYINGQVSECDTYNAGISIGGLSGSAIGSRLTLAVPPLTPQHTDRFIGGVDNVRVYGRPLLETEICAVSGQPAGTCNTACPSHDGDGGPGGFGGGH